MIQAMVYDPEIHNRKSIRLKGYDYSQSGWYFVTICTKDRECCFGEVENEKMILSDIGKIIAEEWQKTEQIRKNVRLDEWVVMPNHVHGIIVIDNDPTVGATRRVAPTVVVHNHDIRAAPTAMAHNHNVQISVTNGCDGSQKSTRPNGPKSGSLGAIIGQIKSNVTKQINKLKDHSDQSVWQRDFYDRIIRNEDELNRIRQYILENPSNWEKDRNNSDNLYM